MTVAETTRRSTAYPCDGVVNTFPFSFKIYSVSDPKVQVTLPSGSVATAAYGTDYIVNVNADQATSPGGSVVMTTPPAAGSSLVVISQLAYDQPLDLPSGGAFSARALMNQLDRMVIQIQQLKALIDGGISLPPGEVSIQLPSVTVRANQVLGFDSLGQATTFPYTVSSTSSGIPQKIISAAYTLILTDANLHLLHPAADTTARIWTIPANATVSFPIGTCITFVNQNGAGVVTIAITSDTMRLAGAGTVGSRTLAANGTATALKISNTEWIIAGTSLT